MQTERRASYRIGLGEESAFLENQRSNKKARIKFLNAAGGAAEMNAVEWMQESRSLPAHFHLGTLLPFQADIALLGPAARTEGEGLVAFRFHGLTGNALGAVSAFLCDLHACHSSRLKRLFSIQDDAIELGATAESPTRSTTGNLTILALLRDYLEREAVPLLLHRDVPPTAVRLADVKIEERDGNWVLLAASSNGKAIEVDEANEHVFYLPGSLAVTWFRTMVRKVSASELAIEAPPLMFQTGFRSSRRVVPPWSQHAMVTIEEPHRGGERTGRRVLEVAADGFSMELTPPHDRLSPGQQLQQVRVDLPLGTVEMQCVLRACRPAPDGDHMIAGFEVVGFGSPEDHDRWMRCLEIGRAHV